MVFFVVIGVSISEFSEHINIEEHKWIDFARVPASLGAVAFSLGGNFVVFIQRFLKFFLIKVYKKKTKVVV